MTTIRQSRRRLPTIISRLPLFIVIFLSSSVCGSEDISLRQIFDAVDVNHDNSISEVEYTNAFHRLVGIATDADGSGGASSAATIAEGAPGLGMEPPRGGGAGRRINYHTETLKFHSPTSTKSFFKALFASFSAIMATEIGDKTFFIAAVLSMRNDRLAVFGGAILALIVMTILSTLMGLVLPALIPKKFTHIIGGLLFLYFGGKLLLDSRGMEDKVSEELEEVEEELAEMNKKQSKKKKRLEKEKLAASADDDGSGDLEGQVVVTAMENGDGGENGAKKRRGGGASGGNRTIKHAPSSSGLSGAADYSGSSWEAVFLQALTLTFLAEWGDRSQIATIALAAAKVSFSFVFFGLNIIYAQGGILLTPNLHHIFFHQDPIGVTIGGCIGHSICTGMAVLGGRMLASRISEKSVAFYGGLVFLAFGVHSVFFEE